MKTPKRIFANTIFTLILFSILSCGGNKDKENSEVKTAVKKEAGIAEVTSEQMKAVGIETGELEQRNLKNIVKGTGSLTVPPQGKAIVNALVGGVIRRINVIEGQQVFKGQPLVVIENPEFIKLQQEYFTSRDNLVFLQQEYDRQLQLKNADAGIGKIFQQSAANLAAEKSKLLTLRMQLQQIHISPSQNNRNIITQVPVLSPISGTVGAIKLSVGSYTDATSPIMEIINNNVIYADLQVFEKDISRVTTGQKVTFILSNQGDKQITGSVTGINTAFESQNKATIVHSSLHSLGNIKLLAGEFVTGLIETGSQTVPALPRDAIVNANNKTYIFILEGTEKEAIKKDDDDKEVTANAQTKFRFKMIEVATGSEEGGMVEIKLFNPLLPGTKVVKKGAFFLYTTTQTINNDDI